MRRSKLAFALGLGCLVLSTKPFSRLGAGTQPGAADEAFRTRPAYALLEKLVRVPPQVLVLQESSRNKKGENGDADWPLYRDERGDDVIFEASGPGCIRSMWGTAFDPGAVIQFYFDGEKEPRLRSNIVDLYKGRHPLFPAPLVSYEKRGRWGDQPYAGNSFVPLPFAESLKISVKGGSRFFHIIYEKYPYPSGVVTFTGKEDRMAVMDAFERLGEAPFEPAGLAGYPVEVQEAAPGQTVSLLKLEKSAGIVREIVIEADGAEDFFEKTLLRMRWDVQAPPGLFFGAAVRADDTRSLPLRVDGLADGRARLTCFFPMPFWDSAEIEWTNATERPMAPLKARVSVGRNAVPRSEGTYFTTLVHSGETIYGRDWLLFEGRGAGWYVGTVQSMRKSHYCEGNEHITLDDAVSPQINGTGSEDYYLACFWPNLDFDSPFACVAGDITREGGGSMAGAYHMPSSYARYHLEAPLPFFSSVDARIQHGGRSDVLSEYRSIGFAYLRKSVGLVETDFIDVGRPESENGHGYRTSAGGPPVTVEVFPEGESFETGARLDGRYHPGGTVRFRVAVDPANAGVRLRRSFDRKGPRQTALVYVDGRYAGTWLDGNGNGFLRWAESDFEIHPDFSRGKAVLGIELRVRAGDGRSPYSDFSYRAFCHAPADAGNR